MSLFSGIGAFEKALTRLNVNYELINYCEIDKYASNAYSIIHNEPESKNLGDITKVNEKKLPDFDLLIGGSPCTNISIAGNQKGLKGNESRLFYDYSRILNHKKPKYFVFENVDNLIRSNNGNDFEIVKSELKTSYNIYYQVLNAKDYNIPQSRKRLFIIGVRKDINNQFKFPEKIELSLTFDQLLEDVVDHKYYLSQKERMYMDRNVKGGRNHWDFKHYHDTNNSYSHCIVANTFKGVPYNVLADGRKCKLGYYDCDFIDDDNMCENCIHGDSFQQNNNITSGERKLTPLECFRLMNFDDEDYYKLKRNKISNTQAYKMAGNSIVVKVSEEIFKNLFK